MTGKIKTITPKGFGFIAIEGKDDMFFHMNDLVGISIEQLKTGDEVTFEEGSGKKGPCAVNVQLA